MMTWESHSGSAVILEVSWQISVIFNLFRFVQ
jgi:hypothetical protein